MGFFACVLVLGFSTAALAGVPDLANTTANTFYHTPVVDGGLGGTETLSLFNLPDATGRAFANAFISPATPTDATILMTLRDGFGDPVVGYAAEDMWIASADAGMVPCSATGTYNTHADSNTDSAGLTQWANPLYAGGYSQAVCIVYIDGDALTSNAGLDLSFNSADINGDGDVNLPDTGFMTDFLGTSTYAGDFNFDGSVNLPDTGFMTSGLGHSCP